MKIFRRFREFAELNSQIKQNMKGHHLRDVLPSLPDKPLKQFTDHRDPSFIQDRCFKLERFVIAMTSIPHVANMVCMKAFLGLMDQVCFIMGLCVYANITCSICVCFLSGMLSVYLFNSYFFLPK